ncbi:HpcH/HpaI aldolase/citrate lyase family protein [Tepidamorphus sp. 3E244]|uniref:HpcH/HpaI aldolase/citrate lyase family protein n=1 Tax=Tepidamorphus sp. 3E244 TaxID=3385498 RepID=UPI0038FC86E5
MPTSIIAPLFVPASRPDRFSKAAACGTDAVILDLEDAVGREAKDTARDALDPSFTDLPVIVRVNAVGTPWHDADIAAVRDAGFAAVMLSKSEDPESVASVAEDAAMPTIALIETALGLANARAIAALNGVTRLAFGSIDYCADLGCAHERNILLAARSELVLASRLAGIAAPIDGVTARINDTDELAADTAHARDIGMTGKLCIHPKQIDGVKAAFMPGEGEIEWARRVLASGDGAASVNGEMVDEPVRIRARAILARAGAAN